MEKEELDEHLEFVRKSIEELNNKINALDNGNWRKNVSNDFDKSMIYSQYQKLRSGYMSLLKRDYDCSKN